MKKQKIDLAKPNACTVIPAGYSAPAHHWDIEPSGNRTSKGTCRHCGKERIFTNSHPEDINWRHGFKLDPDG